MRESSLPPQQKRPWKGVLFPCCGAYGRVYKSLITGIYEGFCPRCGQKATISKTSRELIGAFLCLWFAIGTPGARAEQDSARLSVWIQSGIAFLNFEQRAHFETALDSLYVRWRSEALTAAESSQVSRQLFQKVNFCFPLMIGGETQVYPGLYLGFGAGFWHNREAVIVTDRRGEAHEIFYALQAVPLMAETRMRIPEALISLQGHSHFSAIFRWWWLLRGTEIYSSWGILRANPRLEGNGWSFSLGYEIARRKNINLFGDLGLYQLQTASSFPWSAVVPQYNTSTPIKKARWSLGGIQMQIRGRWSTWNHRP